MECLVCFPISKYSPMGHFTATFIDLLNINYLIKAIAFDIIEVETTTNMSAVRVG